MLVVKLKQMHAFIILVIHIQLAITHTHTHTDNSYLCFSVCAIDFSKARILKCYWLLFATI